MTDEAPPKRRKREMPERDVITSGERYSFVVHEHPHGQGSMKVITVAWGPRKGQAQLIPDNAPALLRFRRAVAAAAAATLPGKFIGAVEMRLTFRLGAPQRVKPANRALELPTVKPDVDKLVRSVFDALSGIAYNDDAQVTRILVEKVWALTDAQIGVVVTIGQARLGTPQQPALNP